MIVEEIVLALLKRNQRHGAVFQVKTYNFFTVSFVKTANPVAIQPHSQIEICLPVSQAHYIPFSAKPMHGLRVNPLEKKALVLSVFFEKIPLDNKPLVFLY